MGKGLPLADVDTPAVGELMLNGLIAAGLALLDWGEGVAGDDAYLEILHRRLGRVRPSERVIYSANPIFIADVVYED